MPSISTVQPLHSATTSCCSSGAGSAHQGWNPESRAGAAPSSATLGSLLTLSASFYDRNSPFTARRSRKGNSQALQVLFYCLYWVQSLVRGLRRRKVMKKKNFEQYLPCIETTSCWWEHIPASSFPHSLPQETETLSWGRDVNVGFLSTPAFTAGTLRWGRDLPVLFLSPYLSSLSLIPTFK